MSVGNGATVLSASGLAGMGAVATHYKATELYPYVLEVCKRSDIEIEKVTDRIERAKIKKEKYRNKSKVEINFKRWVKWKYNGEPKMWLIREGSLVKQIFEVEKEGKSVEVTLCLREQ